MEFFFIIAGSIIFYFAFYEKQSNFSCNLAKPEIEISTKIADSENKVAIVVLSGLFCHQENVEVILEHCKKLIEKGFTKIVFDLSLVEKINSTVVGSFLNVKSKCENKKGDVAIFSKKNTYCYTIFYSTFHCWIDWHLSQSLESTVNELRHL